MVDSRVEFREKLTKVWQNWEIQNFASELEESRRINEVIQKFLQAKVTEVKNIGWKFREL